LFRKEILRGISVWARNGVHLHLLVATCLQAYTSTGFFKGCLCFVGVEKSIPEVLMLVLLVNLVTAARTVAGEVVANVTVISFWTVECVVKGNYHFTTDPLKNLGSCHQNALVEICVGMVNVNCAVYGGNPS
jgi:hypothetical protein